VLKGPRAREVSVLFLQHAVESIWLAVKDLIDPAQPTDVRQFTLTFLRNLIFGQVRQLRSNPQIQNMSHVWSF